MADQKQTKLIRKKFSRTVVTGFKCTLCGTETVTYDGSIPDKCLDPGCQEPNPVRKWQNIVTNSTTVEVIN